MHIFLKRAAVASDGADTPTSKVAAPATFADNPTSRPVAKALWASEAFALQTGRLVAVRMAANGVEVALIQNGATALGWVSASTVMSRSQEKQWLRAARFTLR